MSEVRAIELTPHERVIDIDIRGGVDIDISGGIDIDIRGAVDI